MILFELEWLLVCFDLRRKLTTFFCQGLIFLWDADNGLSQIDKYFHSTESAVLAGSQLAVGIVTCGIMNECDPVGSFLLHILQSFLF